ncbi:Uncharacterised protein [Mycobacteroides abscessus subsp. abscessus]|nr:Uncharacterised protein [Mycobacteroides abscessus subsp. abscessus]
MLSSALSRAPADDARAFRRPTPIAQCAKVRRKGPASCSAASRPILAFTQTRGTPRNSVGRTSVSALSTALGSATVVICRPYNRFW